MPRKSTKCVAPADADVEVEVVMDCPKTVLLPIGNDDNVESTNVTIDVTTTTTKTRKTVVEKIDAVLEMIEQNASVSAITKQLQSIRKALDGAQIKTSKKTRKPNQYNLFMSEQMEKLKESDMPATERFKHCIKLWNERKETETTA